MKCVWIVLLVSGGLVGASVIQSFAAAAESPWSIERSRVSWSQSQAWGDKISVTNGVSLQGGNVGQWTSKWHSWQKPVDAAEVAVRAGVSRFTNQTVQVVVNGDDISPQISGGIPNTMWQRARLYKESNPTFQHGNSRDYTRGEGRLWGFGIHTMGGGWGASQHTRKPAAYWSDDNGRTWYGPQLLHGPMYPGPDTGYGDLKRRRDGTFVAATYYCPPDNLDTAHVEQYTFGEQRAEILIEADRNGDGVSDADSGWREIYNGSNIYSVSGLRAGHWRLRLRLSSTADAGSPKIVQVTVAPR